MQGALNFDLSGWAQGFVAALREEGMIQGRGDNLFTPKASTTRAEAVVLLLNRIDRA
ncbi:S-layer homology domain-containing protein [Paenibacillus sp. sgz302251]|uniref:S-layer homology domain-containing protein n=1 Tax=Paenibacillus sp. sgz302251 TaxID=3414493 RepID=UPI003C7B4226